MGSCTVAASAEECVSFHLLSEAAFQPCTGAQFRRNNKSQVSHSEEFFNRKHTSQREARKCLLASKQIGEGQKDRKALSRGIAVSTRSGFSRH